MVKLVDLVAYCDDLLDVDRYQDYCPNGLQVQGGAVVKKLVSGVTASQALLDVAVEAKADAILVHHGYFWKGENPRIVGIKQRRLQTLLNNNISLIAYHLPLDGHLELGNNAQLGKLCGFLSESQFGGQGHQVDIVWRGSLPTALRPDALRMKISECLRRDALLIHADTAKKTIKSIAWCTGAAQSYIEQAAEQGVDAFISGEISEQTVHLARELGIHYISAGHHATERYGVQALAVHLQDKFQIENQFIDIENPV